MAQQDENEDLSAGSKNEPVPRADQADPPATSGIGIGAGTLREEDKGKQMNGTDPSIAESKESPAVRTVMDTVEQPVNGHVQGINCNASNPEAPSSVRDPQAKLSAMLSGREAPPAMAETGAGMDVARPQASGDITFCLVENNGTPENSERLVALKNIFAKQLPKMPKEYIVRLVFDRRHRAVALCRGNLVIGGICYRPYPSQRFAEIAFCAIMATEQVKGYGTRLMNHLKEQAKREGLRYFLTYADNYAIGYFRKQGFSKTLGMPRAQWMGYIKDYDGAHLMECYVHPTINYLDVPDMIARQRAYIHSRLKVKSKSHVIYPGLACFKALKEGRKEGGRVRDVMEVPGVKEAGWNLRESGPVSQRDTDRERAALQLFFNGILREVYNHRAAWPFLEPVDTSEVPDYLDVVSDPIDLSLIERRIKEGQSEAGSGGGYYRNREMLLADLMRMCRNCKKYNDPSTDYYAAGQEMEGFVRQLFKKALAKGEGTGGEEIVGKKGVGEG